MSRFLGSGGQGEVYEVDLDKHPHEKFALKCYFDTSATNDQWEAIERLVEIGPPDNRFLWPVDLVRLPASRSFGYLMPKRAARFHGLVDFLDCRVSTSFWALTTVAYALADSYLRLHANGLCYRDISYGNAFFDPDTGDVLICDNDNVAIDGQGHVGILGTPRFMAPEIVRGEALPSTRTDLYSLSVLLFYLLIRHHPLVGARELDYPLLDAKAIEDLFGCRPLFIFDPEDRSNEPVSGIHDNALILWPLYPAFIRDLFTRAFTAGVRDPLNGRVAEVAWKSAMIRLRDSIAYCSHCNSENFLDLGSKDGSLEVKCWSCQEIVPSPFRLQLKRHAVLLNHNTQLFAHHVSGRKFEFSSPLAAVEQHPERERVWGLRNLSGQKWTITDHRGVLHDIAPGRVVPLREGIRIQFPHAEGEIVY